MEKEITRAEVKEIFLAMQRVSQEKIPKKFAYGLSRNKSRMTEELTAIGEVEKPLEQFDKDRITLCEKYATKDKDGKPLTRNGAYVGLESNYEFKKEMEALSKPFAKDQIEINEFLTGKVKIDFYQVAYEDVPDVITGADLDLLMPIIREPEEDTELEKARTEVTDLKKKVADLELQVSKKKD